MDLSCCVDLHQDQHSSILSPLECVLPKEILVGVLGGDSLQYFGVFRPTDLPLKFLTGLQVFIGFAICLLSFCSPVKAYWLEWDLVWVSKNKFHCKGENVSLPLSGGLSVVGDFYATVLPMCMVYTIARSQRQKLGLYVLFGLGSLSVLAGIVRTYLMHRLINV